MFRIFFCLLRTTVQYFKVPQLRLYYPVENQLSMDHPRSWNAYADLKNVPTRKLIQTLSSFFDENLEKSILT